MAYAVAQQTLIQSVQRAFRLLEAVADHDGRASAKQLARFTQISLPTTYHLLRTLVHEGYLQRLDDGCYVIGDRIDLVRRQGQAARRMAAARPALEWLRDELRSAVYLALYDAGEIVLTEIVDSPSSPRVELWVGIHDAAHATALGKCILSTLDEERRADYLSRHPLHALTRHTVVDRRQLTEVLQGSGSLATDDQEYALGVGCLAVPVVAEGVVGAVGVVTTPGRLRHWAAASAVLADGAARVSRALVLV